MLEDNWSDRKPRQISNAFLQSIPVAAKIVWKAKAIRQLFQQVLLRGDPNRNLRHQARRYSQMQVVEAK